jgi:hypothetical protein
MREENWDDIFWVADRCDEIAIDNGFTQPTWENFLSKMMLAVTELDEGVQFINGGNGESLEIELADFTIRLFSVMSALWGNQWSDRRNTLSLHNQKRRKMRFSCVERLLWPLLSKVSNSVEYWRINEREDVKISLEYAVQHVFEISNVLEFDLMKVIRDKCKKNNG